MIRRQIVCGLLAAAVVSIALQNAALAADPADGRLPVPDKAALEKSRQLLMDVFKEDFARAKRPNPRLQLIDKLIEQSETTRDDPASSFAMLQEAADAGDPQRAKRCVEALAAKFAVDPLELSTASFERMAGKVHPSETKKLIAEAALPSLDEALAARRYELATRLANACLTSARKAKDGTVLKRAIEAGARATTARQFWEAKERAVATLATTPDDPAANLVLGKYLCFTDGNLKAGLPHLAKGSDAMLKGLAAASLPQPEAADALNGLAEQWWVAAEKAKGRDKADLQFAAACFYTDALPGLTGLARLKVEQRLNDLGTDVTKAVARTRTTNLRSARLLYSDEFDASSVGWVTAGTDPKVSGYSDGCLYVANGRGGSTWSARPWSASNFACVLVGRVKSEASASWGLVLESAEGRFGIRVSVTNDQKLGIRPFSNDLPGITLGLFDLPQLKPGAEFGTLVVTVRQSRMEVYVNGSRVCEPVSLPNIDTIKLRCIVVCSKPARAEFERIAVYALPPDEAAASALAKNLSSLDSSTRLPESPTSDEQLDRSVALWVLSRGGDVALAPPSKRWGPLPYFNDAAKLPATPFPLLAIRLTNNGSINDQDMARIEHLTNLVHLRVDGTSLGNETLAHAARVGSLKFLNFQGTRITDDGLALLEKMPQLTYLSLRGTGMTDLGAEHLRRLTNLEYLNISDTPITDGAIAGLGELKKLEILYISDNRLSAASCSALSGLKQLTEVSLARTKTTDADLDALTRFPNLKLLFLNETPITDQGLAVLAGIPSLETLHVEKTRVTEGGIRRFKQRVPDCRVVQ